MTGTHYPNARERLIQQAEELASLSAQLRETGNVHEGLVTEEGAPDVLAVAQTLLLIHFDVLVIASDLQPRTSRR